MTKEGLLSHINSAQVLPHLRTIIDLIRKDKLGFSSEDIGLHSIRSGGAMAMFLSGISTIIIQRIGRWSSEAFLEYIRDQVETFTLGVSKKMLKFEHFHTLNAEQSPAQLKENLEDIFIKNKQGDGRPVTIEHELNFSDLSLN